MNDQSSLHLSRDELEFEHTEFPRHQENGKRGTAICIGERGFTLAEMAIVLVIVMLLLSGMLIPFATQIQNKRIADTQKTLDEIKEALIGYAIINKRLPRPATSTTDGTEIGACATHAACTGLVPWTTLGVNRLDAWGKIVKYSVSPSFTTTLTPPPLVSDTKTIKTRDPGGSLINQTIDIRVVLLSFGSKNFGTSDSGVSLPNNSTTNIDEQSNSTATQDTFVNRSTTDVTTAAGGEYDDFVIGISTNTIIARMQQAGQYP